MTVEITLPKEKIRIEINQGNLKDVLDSLDSILKPYNFSVNDAIEGVINVNFK